MSAAGVVARSLSSRYGNFHSAGGNRCLILLLVLRLTQCEYEHEHEHGYGYEYRHESKYECVQGDEDTR